MSALKHSFGSAYYTPVVDARRRIEAVDYLVTRLKREAFDSIAVRGTSGVSLGAVTAYMLNKGLCIVRKPNENRHSDYDIEGPIGDRYVIVDDFISTGETVKTIVASLKEVSSAECVGVICYATETWREADCIEQNHYFQLTNQRCLC